MEPAKPPLSHETKTDASVNRPPGSRITGHGSRTTDHGSRPTPFERAHESGMMFGQAVLEYVERTRRETVGANPAESAEAQDLNREAAAARTQAEAEMASVQERLSQSEVPEAEPEPETPEMLAKRQAMGEKREAVAKLEAELKQFEGFGALKRLAEGGRAERQHIMDDLRQAKFEYVQARAEFVGTSAIRMLAERTALADKVAQERNQEKGLGEKVYDVYKKLGDMSLAKIWKPKSKAGRFVAKTMNVRMLISAGLLGVGLAAGAAGGVGVGLGVLAARRAFAGAGASFGSYDLMRMVADRRTGKVDEKKLESMTNVEIVSRLERLEAENMRNGTEVSKHEGYQKLFAEYARRAQAADESSAENLARQPQSAEEADYERQWAQFMEDADRTLETARSKNAKMNRAIKVASGAVGVIVGSGLLAKVVGAVAHEVSGPKPLVAETHLGKTATNIAPAHEATDAGIVRGLAAERLAAGTFNKGDTLQSVTRRLLLQNPKEYGFTGNVRDQAALAKWAGTQTDRMLRDQGFVRQAAQGSARLTRLTGVTSVDQNHAAHAMLVRDAKGVLRVQLDQNAKLVESAHGDKLFSESGLANVRQMAAEARSEIARNQSGLDNANEALRGMDPQKIADMRKIVNHERYMDTHPSGEGTVRYSPDLIKKWSGMVRDYDQAQSRQAFYSEKLAEAQDKLRYATTQESHIRGQMADWEAVRGKGFGQPRVGRFNADELLRAENAPRTVPEAAAPKPPEAAPVTLTGKGTSAINRGPGALSATASVAGALSGIGMATAHMPKRREKPPVKPTTMEEQIASTVDQPEAEPENSNPFSVREPAPPDSGSANVP